MSPDAHPIAVSPAVSASRVFAWGTVAVLAAFLLNNYLSNWRGWPGPAAIFENGGLAWLQAALYLLALAGAAGYVFASRARPLRADGDALYAVTAYVIRACFWAVLLIGLADTVVSFLRVEGMLPGLLGAGLTTELGRSSFRGTYVHFPLVIAAFAIAGLVRGLGFHWLALLVVGAELLIVLSRFIFSYEQAFMGDLVRFWYAALFLFASAYTLLEEGHVRVDVLYSLFNDRMRGLANAWGTALLGMPLCWVVIYFGMNGRSSIINSPLLSYEVTQTGFGMYVKYWMAGFLGIFAISMLIQFAGYFLHAVADYRGDPGHHDTAPEGPHMIPAG
jgi:TRAP-type mannitol/chloroaromatic compound transport system permease small subunit